MIEKNKQGLKCVIEIQCRQHVKKKFFYDIYKRIRIFFHSIFVITAKINYFQWN